ncbi:MAG: hypothetical protein A2Y45_00480 [Tenericutes bacterium GWC2_34_14]|nr:MAG: hypothetical protein A2Y45_00480 [Tenericutes bacterium GWC2_34_14]OHE34476.1 MAG: hypothetical protein A2012_08100 [Tenericutes bacterium GWE2_34_108]OHE35832.1 MAG: hypothetical protein A2Y46_02805 [Tenericutes bacterium GWF1_35_14]OHE39081.1 MAG: hypothetical protein A2Y44_07125 [Tenericutes bacterium GWF2_35_184]OHE42852.1 MAG: hypothetical protein A2221_09110 [Tenericutes bacterium RIFOXYA2_FULL_36_32]OHE44032.1 MAG: hypothetical protein A3K26_09300 [Tenericutes bacterium RIFOXYA1
MNTRITVVNKKNFNIYESLADQFVNLHFYGLFNINSFNRKYLKLRYKYLFIKDDSCAIFVFRDSIAIGLVYGGPDGYNNESNKLILKNHWIKLLSFRLLSMIWLKKTIRLLLKFRFYRNKEVKQSSLNKEYRLTGIVANSNYRSQGIGTILVGEFIKYAKLMNYERIIVKTPKDNLRAIKFYESLNFNIGKDLKNEVELYLKL